MPKIKTSYMKGTWIFKEKEKEWDPFKWLFSEEWEAWGVNSIDCLILNLHIPYCSWLHHIVLYSHSLLSLIHKFLLFYNTKISLLLILLSLLYANLWFHDLRINWNTVHCPEKIYYYMGEAFPAWLILIHYANTHNSF